MLRNHSNTNIDDGPHTLRSVIHSPEISILRPSHHSLSLISNSLEISQSPTTALLQEPDKSHCSTFDTQISGATANICNKSSFYKPAPPEISTSVCTTNAESIQQFSDNVQLASNKYLKEVSEDKNTDGRIPAQSCQSVLGPSEANLPEVLHELSPGITNPKNNLLSKPPSNPSYNVGPNIFFSSDTPPPPSVSSICSQQFFSFVIFHASEDFVLANRVCNDLESYGVGKGTTFCEGFETPGVSPLTCLENAVENSAYIILLLTNAFLQAKWGGFQSTTAMMNSIDKAHKLGSVIPFYPRLNQIKGKIPIWIKSIIALDENSPSFTMKVHNTFKPDVILKHYELWKKEMNITTDCLYLPQQQNISIQWSMGDATTLLPQQTQHPLSVIHGQTPVIQISHARNVQIGNQNSMNIQVSPNEPQTDSDTNIDQDAEYATPN